MRQESARHTHRRDEVDLDIVGPGFGVGFNKGAECRIAPGIVDQHVYPAQFAQYALRQCRYGLRIAQVSGNPYRLRGTTRLSLGDDCRARFGIAPADHDACTFSGKGHGGGATDIRRDRKSVV